MNEENEMKTEDLTYGTGILGGERIKDKIGKSCQRTLDTGTDAYLIKKLIRIQAPNGEEFIPTKISKEYRKIYGKSSSSLSGQMYAQKKAGFLENRKPNDDEVKIFGKGVRIWKATKKFYDYMDEVDAYLKNIAEDEEKYNSKLGDNEHELSTDVEE